jgi:hypothetical protein
VYADAEAKRFVRAAGEVLHVLACFEVLSMGAVGEWKRGRNRELDHEPPLGKGGILVIRQGIRSSISCSTPPLTAALFLDVQPSTATSTKAVQVSTGSAIAVLMQVRVQVSSLS